MRTLIIGDVHGCKDELEDIVEKFGFVLGKDRLFQTGDLITRGPASFATLEFAHQLGIRSVLGNHEARFISLLNKTAAERSPKEQNYLDRLPFDHQRMLELLWDFPLWIDEPDFLLVHAGLEPGKTRLEDMQRKVLLSIRTWDGSGDDLDRPGDPAWFDCVTWPKTVVFGHWALGGLVVRPGLRGLDTGCVYGKSLSAWCVEEDRIYQVPARKVYSVLKLGELK